MMDLSVISLRNFDTRFVFIGLIEAAFRYLLQTNGVIWIDLGRHET